MPTTTPAPTTRFAAYDDQAIWGVGTTPEAAIEAAAQHVNAEDAERLRATVQTAPMDRALADRVDAQGGALAFRLEGGVLVWEREDAGAE